MEKKTDKQSSGIVIALRLFAALAMALVVSLLPLAQPATAGSSYTCPDGSTAQDVNGDGNVDAADCPIDIVDPDLRGNVTVKAGCGFLKVTNHEVSVMRFRFGRTHHRLLHHYKVAPGATRKIKTHLRRIDWKASWNTKDPRTGHKRVRQHCGSSTPSALPNTGA